MALATENERRIAEAQAYVIELHRELARENGAPSPGIQNQAVEFILADPALRDAVARWARGAEIDEATTAPPQRLPRDPLYRRVREHLEHIMEPPVFARPAPPQA